MAASSSGGSLLRDRAADTRYAPAAGALSLAAETTLEARRGGRPEDRPDRRWRGGETRHRGHVDPREPSRHIACSPSPARGRSTSLREARTRADDERSSTWRNLIWQRW